jgi:AcrR family transcriptional regulator
VSTTARLGRRAANKVRTREAVVEAAVRLLQRDGLESLTAEKVADEAGISRRTFFNYFPSVEAVYAFQAQQVFDHLRGALAARPVDEPLIDGAKAVVAEVFDADSLADAVRTWRVVDSCPAANRYALEATSDALVELAGEWVKDRLPSDTPQLRRLRVAVLTAACIGAFDVARRDWLDRHAGPVDARARDDFVHTVGTAFEVLRPAVEYP